MKKNILILFLAIASVSCKKDKKNSIETYTLDVKTLEIFVDQGHEFKLTKQDEVISAESWTSSNPTVGTINNSGLFIAKKEGTTDVKANGAICKVTVKPYSGLWFEPYLGFNANASKIRSFDIRPFEMQSPEVLILKGENPKIRYVRYEMFNNNMRNAFLIFIEYSGIHEDVEKFYRERYSYVRTDDYIVFSDNKTVTIGIGYRPGYGFHAIYAPFQQGNPILL